ncbi:hypothetical protein KEM56_004297 [Ascosphaera pollenicola]|nr:hypothetical protein KEM56_004297 [Ascosphaera pollenicola]
MPISDELFIDQPLTTIRSGDQHRSRPSGGERTPRYHRDSGSSGNYERSKSANPRAQSRPRYYAKQAANGNEYRHSQEPPPLPAMTPKNPRYPVNTSKSTPTQAQRPPSHTPSHDYPRQLLVTNPELSFARSQERPRSQPTQDAGRQSGSYRVAPDSQQQPHSRMGSLNTPNYNVHNRTTSASGNRVTPETPNHSPRLLPNMTITEPFIGMRASPPTIDLPANLMPGPEDRRSVSSPMRQPPSQQAQALNSPFARQSIFNGPLLLKQEPQPYTLSAATTTAPPVVAYNAFNPQLMARRTTSVVNAPQPESQVIGMQPIHERPNTAPIHSPPPTRLGSVVNSTMPNNTGSQMNKIETPQPSKNDISSNQDEVLDQIDTSIVAQLHQADVTSTLSPVVESANPSLPNIEGLDLAQSVSPNASVPASPNIDTPPIGPTDPNALEDSQAFPKLGATVKADDDWQNGPEQPVQNGHTAGSEQTCLQRSAQSQPQPQPSSPALSIQAAKPPQKSRFGTIGKVFIICCQCDRFHDLPPPVLEMLLCGCGPGIQGFTGDDGSLDLTQTCVDGLPSPRAAMSARAN